MKAKVAQCTCNHSGQDKLHGNKQRVHNPTIGKAQVGHTNYRCTVCGKEQVLVTV